MEIQHGERNLKTRRQRLYEIRKSFLRNWQLYLFLLPALTYFFIFHYIPMYVVQIAFKDYFANLGIIGSPWVWFEHFERCFDSYYFWRLLKHTIILNAYTLLLFPLPFICAPSLIQLIAAPFQKWP